MVRTFEDKHVWRPTRCWATDSAVQGNPRLPAVEDAARSGMPDGRPILEAMGILVHRGSDCADPETRSSGVTLFKIIYVTSALECSEAHDGPLSSDSCMSQ